MARNAPRRPEADGIDFLRSRAHDSGGPRNPNQCCPCPSLSRNPRPSRRMPMRHVLTGLWPGGRRYVQGRKAQKRRACLTGRFLAPGCRG